MVSSAALPSLERKLGGPDNWVEKAGGLPSYIERIAKHLHYERGMTISHAIASAVNTVKRWARMGTVAKYGDPNHKRVSPATVAKAIAAVAEWNAKRASGKLSLTDAEFAVIDMTSITGEFALDLADDLGYCEYIDLADTEKSHLKDQSCKYCKNPATKSILWAEGNAYIPVCDAHLNQGKSDVVDPFTHKTDPDGINRIYDLGTKRPIDLADADVDDTDAMTAVMIDPKVAKQIAVPGGVPASDMHITLTFHKDVDDIKFAELVEQVKEAVAAHDGGPIEGTIGGLGNFEAKNPDKGAPYFAKVKVPALADLQHAVAGTTDYESDYDQYTPHVTLTYVKDGETPPTPVPDTPVTFTGVWVVQGDNRREEVRLPGTSAESTRYATLATNVNVSGAGVNLRDLSDRADSIADPLERAAARQAILDLAHAAAGKHIDLSSTIAPRGGGKGKTRVDKRPSFKKQGKWGHGFVPKDQAAKEAKAKGSPIAMKRVTRVFGKSGAPKVGQARVKAATGRVGNRSAGGKKDNDVEIKVDEKNHPGSERVQDIAQLRNTPVTGRANKNVTSGGKDATLPKEQKEASKSSRIPERARQNWDEIPEALKTVRGGKKYVLAEFGGKQYVTEWVGGVQRVSQTDLAHRKVMRTLSSADAADMSTAELRALADNSRNSEEVRRVARRALKDLADKEASK